MSVGNLLAGLRSRLQDRRWGARIPVDGTEKDTGVQVLAEEVANGLGAGGVTDVYEPVRLRWHGAGPLFVIEDVGETGQALQIVRRSEDGREKVRAATVGVGLESDGLLANAVLPSPAFQFDPNEQFGYYDRGLPYVYTKPGGPGSTNVGDDGAGGVGYPPKYRRPQGVQIPGDGWGVEVPWGLAMIEGALTADLDAPGGITDTPTTAAASIYGMDPATGQLFDAGVAVTLHNVDPNLKGKSGDYFMAVRRGNFWRPVRIGRSICDRLKDIDGYNAGADLQVVGHETGTCTWKTPSACP